MTEQTRNGRKQSRKTSCLALLLLVVVNSCLTKKEKRKKINLLPFAKVFPLANEVFFDFHESFLREIRPKNYYSRNFLSKTSRFFDLPKVSARESFCPYSIILLLFGCQTNLDFKYNQALIG